MSTIKTRKKFWLMISVVCMIMVFTSLTAYGDSAASLGAGTETTTTDSPAPAGTDPAGTDLETGGTTTDPGNTATGGTDNGAADSGNNTPDSSTDNTGSGNDGNTDTDSGTEDPAPDPGDNAGLLETEGLNAMALSALDMGITATTYDLANPSVATSLQLSMKVNGQDVTTLTDIPRDSTLAVALKYTLSNQLHLTSADTLTYAFPSQLIMNATSGTIYSGTTAAGTYSLSGNMLTIQLSQTFLDSGFSNISGQVTLNGKFNLSDISGGGGTSFSFTGGTTITLDIADPGVTATKKVLSNTIDTDGCLTYQITVTSDGTVNNAVFTDTLGTGLSYVAGSASPYTPALDGQKVIFTVPTVSYGSPVTITYKVKVADSQFYKVASTAVNLTNSVAWINNGQTKTATTSTALSKGWISKSGTMQDSSTGKVKWTVVYNAGYPIDITGSTLSDTFPAGSVLDGSITATGADGTTTFSIPVNSNGDGFSYVVGANGESGAQKYTVVYYTKLTPEYAALSGSTDLTNTAYLKNVNFTATNNTISKTATVTRTNGSGTTYLTKAVNSIDYDNMETTWKITVDVPDNNTTFKLTSVVDTTEAANTNPITWWLLKSDYSVTYADGSAIGVTPTFSWSGYNADTSKAYKVTINFGGNFVPTQDVVITLKTKHDVSAMTSLTKTYTNTALGNYNINGASVYSSASANWTFTYSKLNIRKTAGAYRYDAASGKYLIDWTVTLNDLDKNSTADADYTGKAISVVDTLPAGLTYLDGSVAVKYGSTNGAAPTVSVNGSDVTFSPLNVNKTVTTLTFTTEVDPTILLDNADHTFTNQASSYIDGTKSETASAGKTVTAQILNKAGARAADGFLITYTIDVNKAKLDLDPNAGYVILSDILQNNLTLATDSIQVLAGGTSNALPVNQYSVNYNGTTRKLSFTLPDSTYVTVKYSVKLEGTVGQNLSVSNTATLTGQSSVSTGTQNTYQVTSSSASVEIAANAIRIKKVDADSLSKTLPGATFTLYSVNQLTGLLSEVKSLTTASDGYALFDELAYDQIYCLKETAPPSQYKITYEPYYFVVPGSDTTDWAAVFRIMGITNYDTRGGDIVATDSKTDVSISKKAATGSDELPGASLKVMDGQTLVDSWTSTGEAHHSKGLVAGHTYTLIETTAPNGYETAESVNFTLNADGSCDPVVMRDAPTDVSFSKTSITGTDELPGAELAVYEGDTLIDSWTSTDEAHHIIGQLVAGHTYTLVETTAPDGYNVAEAIAFTLNDDGTCDPVVMQDAPTDVTFSKTSVTGTEEIPGAELKIMDGDTVIESWTSEATPHQIVAKLLAGHTYTLSETTAPDGYQLAEAVEFTVGNDGEPQTVTIKDAPTDVTFSKTSVTGTDELPGAELAVYEGDTLIDSWTSTNEAHHIVGQLVAGHTYTMVETTPAGGYKTAESIEFTLNDDGSCDPVVMQDAPTDVTFSKTSVTGTDELPGAELAVYEGDTLIEAWTSTAEAHHIAGKLVAGHTYTMVETTPADGYTVAESIEFSLDADGNCAPVVMKDAPTDVTFSKTSVTGTAELPGAKLKIVDGDGNVVESWTSTDTAHQVVAKLKAGTAYTLVEETAPDGYTVAESVKFTVGVDGKPQTVVMKDKATDVTISKISVTTGKELPGAKLKLVDANGNAVDSWTSTAQPHQIVAKLIAGAQYTLIEETAPNGYTVAEKITFTVGVDGKPQTVVMKDKATDVTISKISATTGKELPGAKLKLVDANGNVVDSWTSTAQPHQIVAKLIAGAQYTLIEETAPNGYTVAEKITFTVNRDGTAQTVTMKDAAVKATATSTKTGDPSNPMLWLGLLAGFAVMLLAVVFLIRAAKKRNQQ